MDCQPHTFVTFKSNLIVLETTSEKADFRESEIESKDVVRDKSDKGGAKRVMNFNDLQAAVKNGLN